MLGRAGFEHIGRRVLTPELLDDLAPGDAAAIRSRRDLRRVHRAMGSVGALLRAVRALRLATPKRVLELGAGDGTLLLRFARRSGWRSVQLTLLDRHDLLSQRTRAAYDALDWTVKVQSRDALEWARASHPMRYDLCMASLFLHHFDDARLAVLLQGVASSCDAFVALEPRRDWLGLMGSHLVGALGVNRVTRVDAVKSVAAGFRGQDISRLWPRRRETGAWQLLESAAPPFAHVFSANARPKMQV